MSSSAASGRYVILHFDISLSPESYRSRVIMHGNGNRNATVEEQIRKRNPWYVGSHFEWAEKPSIRPIYEKRFRYFVACIERAKARLGPNLRLLDAGCGDGYWLARLKGIQGLDLYGVDYNPIRVERAKHAAPTATVHCSDLMSLKTKDPFDLILLSQVIEHVDNDRGLLCKMRTLLRSGGVLILGTPNEGSWLQQLWIRRQGPESETDHVHSYSENEIRSKVLDVGFCIDSVMREVFFIGSYRLYYWLTRRRWGFTFLEFMTRLWPSGCTDLYFECHLPVKKDGSER